MGICLTRAEGDEQKLLEGCREGDLASLDLLVRDHLRMVLSVALRFTANRPDAEDLCQDIFEKVLRGISGFRGESRIGTWIYSIAVAEASNFQRKRANRTSRFSTELEFEPPTDARGPAAQLLEDETVRAVHLAVHSLPDKLKEVVVLHDFENLPHKTISEILRVPEGTVWSRLNTARNLLREKLLRYM